MSGQFEEYLRTIIMNNAQCVRGYPLTATEYNEQLREGLLELNGDREQLSWTCRNQISTQLIPVVKKFILETFERYRAGDLQDGFCWDDLMPIKDNFVNHIRRIT